MALGASAGVAAGDWVAGSEEMSTPMLHVSALTDTVGPGWLLPRADMMSLLISLMADT